MTSGLDTAADRLIDEMGSALQLPAGRRRNKAIRSILMRLHGEVMRAAADVDGTKPQELDRLAAAVRDVVPAGPENKLPVRERVFVRLLRSGAVEPAWTLAGDDAAGVVPTSRAGLKWAGGAERNSVVLPLSTVVEEGRAFAWLPGFRDPRWRLPDSVYDVTADARLRVVLEQLSLEGGRLMLGGSAHFEVLTTRADDEVTVVLRGPGGRMHRVRAERARTPEFVTSSGPELTRLAWSGWHAVVDLTALRQMPGRWSVRLELTQAGLRRSAPLGPDRGPFARTVDGCGPTDERGRVFRLKSGPDGRLSVTVARLGPSARVVPRPLRTALRRPIARR